ncbi:MAG: Rrf2 family transcriptional regulator [Dethiobacteria bacterium]|jgi:Rrf2 family protein|nr:Rrf2 family transcriptional regulator [Bacillota bacterium]NMD33575.1 RrF2 family transcriptional regulator [Bacillota bacterium]HOB29253.1 Rrf2 family transcriptional regulator [Bacillota bacterium]HPZ41865.1 Rrf2 family transcriptional regulator [Bacillota bacterium]HQD52695.1 Rrf2 family transcriptional regulator [Bacillota bacterium]
MKLSARVEYGVRAMAVLALHDCSGPLSLREIARSEEISFQFLEQIFLDLRRAGLVESVRGARGGYYLARPPGEINVGDIVRALEGPIAPVNCLAGDQSREPCCHRGEACRTRHVWEKLRDRINEVLDSVFLDELIESKPGSLVK